MCNTLSKPDRSALRTDTSQQSPRCHLLELPAEIRNQIYHLPATEVTVPPAYPSQPLQTPNLLLICHQIKNEAQPLYFDNRYFRFPNYTSALSWLKSLPLSKRSQVKEIWIDTANTIYYASSSRVTWGHQTEVPMTETSFWDPTPEPDYSNPIPRTGPFDADNDLWHLRRGVRDIEGVSLERCLASIRRPDGTDEFCENPTGRFSRLNLGYRECLKCAGDVRKCGCVCWGCWSGMAQCECKEEDEEIYYDDGDDDDED